MKKPILFLILLLFSIAIYAQGTLQKHLKENSVKVENNKMMMKDYFMSKTEQNNVKVNRQILLSAECPNDGSISRDNFIKATYMLFYFSIGAAMQQGYKFSLIYIDEPIGNVDVKFQIYVNKKGIQMEVISDKPTQRVTLTWEEFDKQAE